MNNNVKLIKGSLKSPYPPISLMGVMLLSLSALSAWSELTLSMMTQLQIEGPCLTSLMGPPTKSCIQWQPNVDAAPTYEPSRRILFAGAADNFLHVVDADNGKRLAQITTIGRVVTNVVFAADSTLMYVGTDKGVVHAIDAYSFVQSFTVNADSKINNDMVLVEDALVFTTALGTMYQINRHNGAITWRIEQAQLQDRLRLSSNANIVAITDTKQSGKEPLVVTPHADGTLSIIGARSGHVHQHITLGVSRGNGFTDIVALMVWFKNKLWVASHNLGLFSLDMPSGKIIDQVSINEIVQLATDGIHLFLASADTVYALSDLGTVIWKNQISDIWSRSAPAAFPFHGFTGGKKRSLYGVPSKLLITQDRLIMATSAGAIGVFDKNSGVLLKLVGDSVGFSPKIGWAGTNDLVAISRRGLLMKFHLASPKKVSSR